MKRMKSSRETWTRTAPSSKAMQVTLLAAPGTQIIQAGTEGFKNSLKNNVVLIPDFWPQKHKNRSWLVVVCEVVRFGLV